jgi:hypothetical protein
LCNNVISIPPPPKAAGGSEHLFHKIIKELTLISYFPVGGAVFITWKRRKKFPFQVLRNLKAGDEFLAGICL